VGFDNVEVAVESKSERMEREEVAITPWRTWAPKGDRRTDVTGESVVEGGTAL
jgi:hypothetical protein